MRRSQQLVSDDEIQFSAFRRVSVVAVELYLTLRKIRTQSTSVVHVSVPGKLSAGAEFWTACRHPTRARNRPAEKSALPVEMGTYM